MENQPPFEAPALPQKIGFGAGLLSQKPLRLDVLAARRGQYAVLDKPADLLFDAYTGAPKQKSVVQAVRAQRGKGELERLGVAAPYAVNQIDYEYSGIAVMALCKESAAAMRNAEGSGGFKFKYKILTRAYRRGETEFEADLPLVMHEKRPVWIVSHRFGKKAKTRFKLAENLGDYQLWDAETYSARPHQIRVHAAECGLDIVGEWIYSKTPYIFLSRLKAEYKLGKNAEERALYPHLAVHLAEVEISPQALGGAGISAAAELPKGFAAMLKKLGGGQPKT